MWKLQRQAEAATRAFNKEIMAEDGAGSADLQSRAKRGGGAGDDAVLFDDTADYETSNDVKVVTTFDSMGLKEDLLRGVYSYGEEQERGEQPAGKGMLAGLRVSKGSEKLLG